MSKTKWFEAAAIAFLVSTMAWAQAPVKDSDSDGIPDEVEHRLGTDPGTAENLQPVWESSAPPAADPSRDIRRILFANVAGNRYLWTLEFGAPFDLKNTNLTVFVDADNVPKYGNRHDKEVLGTDFVMWLSDGGRCCHGYSKTGEGAAPAPTRFAWTGKRVYVCTDMPLNQENGRSQFRAQARCETLEPRTRISETGWLEITAAAESERPKPTIVTVGRPQGDATDSDGDGIPDQAEEQLGADPKTPERLDVVFERPATSKTPAAPERTVSRILFGNVAADRYLWCVEFMADYPALNSNFILYLDADDDPKTGRRNMPGVDFMLSAHDGNAGITAFAPNGDNLAGFVNRMFITRNRLYLCADLPIKQAEGQSVYRATGLSETRNPAKGVDSTNWFAARGAGMSNRKKSAGFEDCAENQEVGMTRGLDLFRAVKADPANLVVKIGNCAFEGFEDDLRSEYKEPSAIRTAPGGRIMAAAPQDGRYHFAFLLYDQAGTERVEIRRGDQRLGVAVADEDDRRTKLFFTQQAHDFKAGELIELRTPISAGNYRIEDILFLARTPEVRPRVFEISDLEVTPVWDGETVKPGVARVTWTTTWPAKCTVKCGTQTTTEAEELANHRILLEGLTPNATHTLQVIAPKPKGGDVVSAPVTFSTAAPAVKATSEGGQISLKVQNPSADAVTAWPVTSGVPFPRGALAAAAHLRLLGPDGAERPLQAQTLARWPDGTVKWALLSFRAEAAANGSASYTLEYGAKAKPSGIKTGLSVEENASGATIATGPMRIEISRASGLFPGKVWLDKNADGRFADDEVVGAGGAATLIAEKGNAFTTLGPPDEIVIEERGPERAVALVRGRHAMPSGEKLFAYEVRIMAYAGQRFVRLFYTFGNDEITKEFTSVRALDLSFPLEGGAARFEMGGEGQPAAGEAAEAPVLFQDLDDHFSVAAGAKKSEGKRAAGWVRAAGPRATMTVAVRDFWKLYPKALSAAPDGVRVGLMPPLKPDQYAEQCKDPAQLVHLFYNMQDGLYKFKVGQTKTHELLISYDEAGAAPLNAFQEGVMAIAPSAWVSESRALGDIAATGGPWASRYDKQMDKGIAAYMRARDSRRDYGMMNYGDWWGERGYNWANIEYDDAHVWLVQFARTGDMRCFTMGDRGAKHYGDVDCIHYHSNAKRIGAGYSHCLGHVGGFFDKNPVVGGSLGGGHSPCHTRTEGLIEHYLLTGDRRSQKAAHGIADYYGGWWMNNYDFDNCRVPGWHIVLTTALYNATGDPFYLNAAKIIARRAIERESPGGGWRRCMVPGHCFDLPRHRGNAGFMVGVLLAGLKYYHEATGDPRALDALTRGTRYLVSETYDAAKNQFRYTTCPNSNAPSSTGNMGCEGFAYAARLTGAPDLVKLARDVVGDIVTRAAGGSASGVRFMPRALRDVERLGATPYSLAAPAELEIVALNAPDGGRETGEDVQAQVEPANAAVEIVAPPDKKGLYRIRVKNGTAVRTNLDAEALVVKDSARLKSGGLLRLEFMPPATDDAARRTTDAAVVVKAHARGETTARLVNPNCEEASALTWQGGPESAGMKLKLPETRAEGTHWSKYWSVEVKGPAGEVEVKLEGMPAFITAPSGRFFCPARPTAKFTFSNPLLPGSGTEIVFDASVSTDPDNTIVEYLWSFGDGTQMKGQKVKRNIKQDDRFMEATLTVRNRWGFEASCTQKLATAAAWLLTLDPKAISRVEAEDFCAQGAGQVQVFERTGASGKMISYWHESVGHWLEWKVNVPKTGEYRVVLKYATQCDGTLRDLKIDGAYPSDAFKKFHLPNTGGFCTEKDDWAYYIIGGDRNPEVVCLAAGTHTIRMSNLNDGCALDFILLALNAPDVGRESQGLQARPGGNQPTK